MPEDGGHNGGIRHHFGSNSAGRGTEVDLGAITPGVIAAFLQQLTPARRLSTVSHQAPYFSLTVRISRGNDRCLCLRGAVDRADRAPC
jgi:hypothetical protein